MAIGTSRESQRAREFGGHARRLETCPQGSTLGAPIRETFRVTGFGCSAPLRVDGRRRADFTARRSGWFWRRDLGRASVQEVEWTGVTNKKAMTRNVEACRSAALSILKLVIRNQFTRLSELSKVEALRRP